MLRGHQQIDANRLAVDAKGEILCAPQEALKQLESHLGLQISNNRLRGMRPAWDKVLQEGLACTASNMATFNNTDMWPKAARTFGYHL